MTGVIKGNLGDVWLCCVRSQKPLLQHSETKKKYIYMCIYIYKLQSKHLAYHTCRRESIVRDVFGSGGMQASASLPSLFSGKREDRRDKGPHHYMYACARHLRTQKKIIYSITKPVDSYGRPKKINRFSFHVHLKKGNKI